ncbi:histidine kinase [Actinoplanes sp. NPDC049598]|uniref:sensor histidine kinase n=1 Tax=Actinoplanes sp. NPDC049598 TaxID=3154626 RepID=UPI0034284922
MGKRKRWEPPWPGDNPGPPWRAGKLSPPGSSEQPGPPDDRVSGDLAAGADLGRRGDVGVGGGVGPGGGYGSRGGSGPAGGPGLAWRADGEGPPWRAANRTGRFRGNRMHPGVGAVIAGVLFHVLGANGLADEGGVFRPMHPWVWALLVVGPIALLWRRVYPVAVFAIAAAASLGFATFAEPTWIYAVAPALALFQIARNGRPTAAAVSAGAAYVAYLLVCGFLADRLGLDPGVRPGVREALLLAVGLAVMIFLGSASKSRAEHLAEIMKVRAERARAREEQERRQASEERLRIARELHDVLGHHLSLINVQAGVGLHLMERQPEQAREALTAIKTASAEALREVRSVLGVLRTEDEAAPRQPALGLSRLDDLTADAGLPVETKVTGEPRDLPPEIDRAAYRIVQEALTNVRKHAGPEATATVAVNYLPTALHLGIRNNGLAADPPRSAWPAVRHGERSGSPQPGGTAAPPTDTLGARRIDKSDISDFTEAWGGAVRGPGAVPGGGVRGPGAVPGGGVGGPSAVQA